MNTLVVVPAPRTPVLTLDVVADFTCPWSFLGMRRMARALGYLRGLDVPPLLRWHGFRLPRGPVAGPDSPWREYLQTRLSGELTPEIAEQTLEEAGRALGIQFRFERIQRVPDTHEAHRLTALAAQEGLQAAVADAIFRAYFEEGIDIGDPLQLVRIGRAAGLADATILAFEDASGEAGSVQAEEQRLLLMGVRNVPNLLLNGRVLVPGPADVDTYVLALDQAVFPPSPSPADNPRLLN